ncbi:MAG: ParB/RepB/Spo0J family partition protein [Acidobacteria bacterium]|nr:ParB/RepB/Spo0J family partition protein [Acidobacteriota bacterium]
MESEQIRPVPTKTFGQSGRPKALGRGLEALLPSAAAPTDSVRHIPISQIDPNPFQARQVFQADRLRELADSIKTHGVLQPIVVRQHGERFLLIAGERRWRATSLAGLAAIPAIVRQVAESEVLELTLIENIQREDLNPIETAEAFARLATDAHLTHDQIATRTGKDRATVTNFLRLLRLPEIIRHRVATGEISMGHAKALLTLPTEAVQKELADRILHEGLSVRQTEAIVAPESRKSGVTSTKKKAIADPNVSAAVQEMERSLGTRVRLTGSQKRGKIIIEYYSSEDLERIFEAIVSK